MVSIDVIYYEAYRNMEAYLELIRDYTDSDNIIDWDKVDEELLRRYKERVEKAGI